ncbi:fasciclin domain-containing protein [uncultured Hyphomonas sp.]|jgi:uncharacterized surface protein with fasciclin (FAS1) repeats|uniref:fasciclin domain-containing protein n=1 Tax=uncultured Hyphomonas sp. TaxID=225298 RepID=UPI000C454278|nr:hypothetical protein [Hyphomonadaceae bacterium]|tara:strand:+ start:17132 stop:18088 length:957 start_codon:yes stop_codon:yes gene_type:complete
MKRTLIIPATIALLTGMAATAQEPNATDMDVNASASVEKTSDTQNIDELSIEELNALQLKVLEDPKASDATTETNTQTMIMAEADTSMSAETDMETGLDTQETYDPALTNPEQMDPAGDVKTPDWDETQSADATVDGSVDADMNDTTTAEADITTDTEMGVGGPDYASETDAMADLAMQGTIADLAAEDPRFTTFVALVEQAGLTDKLDGDAEYTVFAPTNAAFEKLDPELVTKLKSGEADDKLTSILKAHIVEGETLSSNIADGEMSVATLADADISVNKSGDSVTIGNATVVAADIDASNGVIHAVDTVIMPDDES